MPPHRLYTNENFPVPAAERLRALGHDVRTIFDDGLGNRSVSDLDLLARSVAQARALVTLNRSDFKRLHAQDQNHCGIVTCTPDTDLDAPADRIHERISNVLDLARQLIAVTRPQ